MKVIGYTKKVRDNVVEKFKASWPKLWVDYTHKAARRSMVTLEEPHTLTAYVGECVNRRNHLFNTS